MLEIINNLEYENINLEELDIFYDYKRDSLYCSLKKNNINKLGELLKRYQDRTINLYNLKSKTKQRLDGIVELLRIKYLNEDLKSISYLDLEVVEGMDTLFSKLGFDSFEISLIYSVLKNELEDFKVIDLLMLAKEKYQEKMTFVTNYKHLRLYKVLINKLDILINNYLKLKSNSENVNYLKVKYLNEELKKLNLLKESVIEQINFLNLEIEKELSKKVK